MNDKIKIAIIYMDRNQDRETYNILEKISQKLFNNIFEVKIFNSVIFNIKNIQNDYSFIIYSKQQEKLLFQPDMINNKMFGINYNFSQLKTLPKNLKQKVWEDFKTIAEHILKITNEETTLLENKSILLKDGTEVPIRNKENSHEKVLTPNEFLSMITMLKELGIEVITSTKIK